MTVKLPTPQIAYEYALQHGKLDQENELLILKNARLSYLYALDIIKGRWKLGEKSICQDAHYSYWYALSTIKGRWKLGEKSIIQNTNYSYLYAKYVIKGKLPEIMHNKMICYAIENNEDKYVKLYFEFI